MRATFGALCLLLGSTAALLAQGPADQTAAPRGTATVGIWTGVSWHAPGPSGVQRAGDREFVLVALRYRRVLLSSSRIALAYTADLIPVAVVTDNSSEKAGPLRVTNGDLLGTTASGFGLAGGRLKGNTVFGWGAAPAGVEVSVSITRRFGIVVGGTAGFLTFSKPVPFANASKLNATFDVGVGFDMAVGRGWRAIGGYKFHHLSNAGTGDFNPGLNASVWYLGTLLVW